GRAARGRAGGGGHGGGWSGGRGAWGGWTGGWPGCGPWRRQFPGSRYRRWRGSPGPGPDRSRPRAAGRACATAVIGGPESSPGRRRAGGDGHRRFRGPGHRPPGRHHHGHAPARPVPHRYPGHRPAHARRAHRRYGCGLDARHAGLGAMTLGHAAPAPSGANRGERARRSPGHATCRAANLDALPAAVPGSAPRAPRRARYLIPPGTPHRREALAALTLIAALAGLLFAQVTLGLAVAFHAIGKITRWRPVWLAVPAAGGLVWLLAIGPAAALAGFLAAPRAV